ncbi:MAG: hypothetical protein AVDCRST_MAG95-3686 [uncultured Adhaeribacter sp.]|uniref:YdhG-like domain-containing protein n=1 Tax=uncultured Adhaeribacter sp. TaxID=448109 RepID=A0A6J4JSN5_9BACT|nr:MAG: hypothetical protein AVDCRST_MAG95-3686 [uncultured Adhaeribacter sp.]
METVETYLGTFPEPAQNILRQIRAIIKEKAPAAAESISYGIPTYKANGKPLVYFAGFKNHVGLYATPTGHQEFAAELSCYKQGKGSVQFPLNQPIPFDLIGRIVTFRNQEIAVKAKK